MEHYQDKKSEIIFVKYSGKMNIEEMKNTTTEIHKLYNQEDKLKLIIDFSEVKVILGTNIFAIELDEMKNTTKEIIANYEYIKIAAIPGTLENRLFAELYKRMTSNLQNYQYKLFSSIEKAQQWLNESID